MRTRTRTIRRLLAVGALIALAGCTTASGSKSATPALVVTGEAIATIGDHFVAVGGFYNTNCRPAVKVAQLAGFCRAFAEFGPKFKDAYPVAVDTFKAAAAANDVAKARGAEATIVQLSTDLTKIAAQALLVLGK